jgi:hypothetical protein
MSQQPLSALIHGPTKTGKSTAAFTSPLPILALDAEGSTKFINHVGFRGEQRLRKLDWNPLTHALPEYDGSWDIAVVPALSWQIIDTAYQYLRTVPHPFRSVVVDSVTEAQRKCKASLGTEQMQQQHWGTLLSKMDGLIRGLRDLCHDPENALEVSVFVAETRMKDGQWRPYMQGAIETSMPYWVDVCGYATQVAETDAHGIPTGGRVVHMGVYTNDSYVAGERVQGVLPSPILNPNINDIIHFIYNQ